MSILFPRISVITPSYNQAEFLERTICSVLDQNYPNLEYIIIDGGSTDQSVEIIKKYSQFISYWVSEPDNGQSHAINKGLKRATGDWVCWQNSDDIYYPNSFSAIAEAAKNNPKLDLIVGDMYLIDEMDNKIRPICYVKPTYFSLLAEREMILCNQAAFWKREIHNHIGWLNENLHFGFDFEWFLRMLKHTNKAAHIPEYMGALRLHGQTKSSLNQSNFKEEYSAILKNHANIKVNKLFYQFRRLILTLLNGKISYVFNGLVNRVLKRSLIKR